jgi:hypothetical protein
MASLPFCNSLLFALSKANQIQNGRDIQAIADKIFKFVKSKHEPDADTVCAYILCLCGLPTSVAQKAQDILQNMVSSKLQPENTVPALTADVFHTVIDLWACAGDAAKCQEIVDLIVSSQMAIDSSVARVMVSSLAHGTFNLGAMKSDAKFRRSAFWTKRLITPLYVGVGSPSKQELFHGIISQRFMAKVSAKLLKWKPQKKRRT